jgi:trimethylamine--corrinoid protein Co-methyltransferase
MLAAYEPPPMDEGMAQALADFIARRERELPDRVA